MENSNSDKIVFPFHKTNIERRN